MEGTAATKKNKKVECGEGEQLVQAAITRHEEFQQSNLLACSAGI